jgi:hypothetical protein
MSNPPELNEFYHLVVRRAVRQGLVARKPFVWEVQHKETAYVLRSGAETFATMEDAHRSGLLALAQISSESNPDR